MAAEIGDMLTLRALLIAGEAIPSGLNTDNPLIKEQIKIGLIIDKLFITSSTESLTRSERFFIKNQLPDMELAEKHLFSLSDGELSFKKITQSLLVDNYKEQKLSEYVDDVNNPVIKLKVAAELGMVSLGSLEGQKDVTLEDHNFLQAFFSS